MSEEKKSWWRGAIEKVESQIESQQAAKAEVEQQYGQQTASHMFGAKWIHIYAKGYVQVRDVTARKSTTPFERLLAIDSQADVTKKSGFGRAVGAVATAGLNPSSNMRGDVYLIIATETHTHSLRATPTTDSVKAAKALEVAGRGALARNQATQEQTSAAIPQSPAEPDALDQLKKLADLHSAGVLTDEEFEAKKAELLDRM